MILFQVQCIAVQTQKSGKKRSISESKSPSHFACIGVTRGLGVDWHVKCVLAILCERQALMAFRPHWVGGLRLSLNV